MWIFAITTAAPEKTAEGWQYAGSEMEPSRRTECATRRGLQGCRQRGLSDSVRTDQGNNEACGVYNTARDSPNLPRATPCSHSGLAAPESKAIRKSAQGNCEIKLALKGGRDGVASRTKLRSEQRPCTERIAFKGTPQCSCVTGSRTLPSSLHSKIKRFGSRLRNDQSVYSSAMLKCDADSGSVLPDAIGIARNI